MDYYLITGFGHNFNTFKYTKLGTMHSKCEFCGIDSFYNFNDFGRFTYNYMLAKEDCKNICITNIIK